MKLSQRKFDKSTEILFSQIHDNLNFEITFLDIRNQALPIIQQLLYVSLTWQIRKVSEREISRLHLSSITGKLFSNFITTIFTSSMKICESKRDDWVFFVIARISIKIRFSTSAEKNEILLTILSSLFVLFIEPPREHYFASAAWVSNTEVSVVWMNRPQNISVVTLCKSPMWYCQEVSENSHSDIKMILNTFQTHKTSCDGRGWVDELSIPHFSANVSSYIGKWMFTPFQ